MTSSLITAIIIIVLLLPVNGNWVFELKLLSYSNPQHAVYSINQNVYTCCDCPSGVNCVGNTLAQLGSVCTDRDCYNAFLVCVDDGSLRKCAYSKSTEDGDSLTFTNKIVNLDNPLEFEGAFQGPLTVSIVTYDDPSSNTNQAAIQNYIDKIILGNIQLNQNNNFGSVASYNGSNKIVKMDLSYRTQCAEGYSGDDCSTPPSVVQPCSTMSTMCNGVSTEIVVVTESAVCTIPTTSSSASSKVVIPPTKVLGTLPCVYISSSSVINCISTVVVTESVVCPTSTIMCSASSPSSTTSPEILIACSPGKDSSNSSDSSDSNDVTIDFLTLVISLLVLCFFIFTIIVIFVMIICLIKRKQDTFGIKPYELKKY